jgi:predicted methyltransferase
MRGFKLEEFRILRLLYHGVTDPWHVAGHVRLDFPRFAGTVKRLERRGFLTQTAGKISLTPRGREAARRAGLRSLKSTTDRIIRAKTVFKRIAARRPSSTSLYDQGFMTPDSVFRRVELIVAAGNADSKKVAILGDDDLVSIALCLAARPERVTVFEIDQRIVALILKIAHEYRLPIEAECHDLRKPLPSRLKGGFDTFVSDPAETLPGLKMFLGRGLYLLRRGEGAAGYFGLTSIEASTRKWGAIQKWLLDSYALAITHILPGNAYYHNWQDLPDQTAAFKLKSLTAGPAGHWFNSSLIRIETLKAFRPRQTGRVRGSLFYDAEASAKPGGTRI